MKRKKTPQKNYDVYIHCMLHYSASYTNYNFKKNENRNMTTKQIALLSGKAGIHHAAILLENELVDEKDRFCIFELYLNDTEPKLEYTC